MDRRRNLGQTADLFHPDAFLGRTVLVTGGSRGIGLAIAARFARHGARVLLTSRSRQSAEAAVRKLQGSRGEVAGHVLDVTDARAATELVGRLSDEGEAVDILVNNAGTNIPQKALDTTEEAWDTIHATNLRGLFFTSQAFARAWVAASTPGVIVNVASQAGLVAIDLRAAYCSSKAGVINLTRELALEWAQHDIRVNAVAPTFVRTPMTEPMLADPDFAARVTSMIPLGRLAEADEVADATLFLASEAARFITGHTLVVDGGWTIH